MSRCKLCALFIHLLLYILHNSSTTILITDDVIIQLLMLIGLLYNEAQQDAKVAQTTLTYILTVHRNEKKWNKKKYRYQMCLDSDHKQ